MGMARKKGQEFRRGDILEIVNAAPTWTAGGPEEWNGRIVVYAGMVNLRFKFQWVSLPPPDWHNKEFFTLGQVEGIFKRLGRCEL